MTFCARWTGTLAMGKSDFKALPPLGRRILFSHSLRGQCVHCMDGGGSSQEHQGCSPTGDIQDLALVACFLTLFGVLASRFSVRIPKR